MFSLKGKKALVTGASRGIGRGIALALAEQGADVAVNYRSSGDKAKLVVEEIKQMGRKACLVQADVSQKKEVVAMVGKTIVELGGIDILVNNAGVITFSSFENLTEEEWDKIMAVNLKGQFLCAQAVALIMKENGWGRIINIASIASGGVGVGFFNLAHYCASKGGVVALTEELALELGPVINVNAIAPGVIDTDMINNLKKDEKAIQGTMARVAKKRLGQPKDIGAAAAFLASEEADYITGTVTYVDGGWLAS